MPFTIREDKLIIKVNKYMKITKLHKLENYKGDEYEVPQNGIANVLVYLSSYFTPDTTKWDSRNNIFFFVSLYVILIPNSFIIQDN